MSIAIEQQQGTNDRKRLAVPQTLWDEALVNPTERFLSRCGKRVRAAMVNESFRLAGGEGEAPKDIVDGIELLHAGSLIVDDIEDDSSERRGRPTLHREVGMPLALNSGNWMYFRSLEKFGEYRTTAKRSRRILMHAIRTSRRCHEGQALDLAASVTRLEPEQIYPTALEVSRLKTGGLTRLASSLGALAAGANPATFRALGQFGMRLGIVLQMHNDLSELRQFHQGENRCDDLRNARITWPWAWATKTISRTELIVLRNRLIRGLDDFDELRSLAGRLIELIGERGASLIDARLHRAVAALESHVDSPKPMRSVIQHFKATTDAKREKVCQLQ